MKNAKIIIVETHDKILDIITEKIDRLTNFDWHPDYPEYSESVIDIDFFVKQLDPVMYEENWVAVLASRGLVKEVTWIHPRCLDPEWIDPKSGLCYDQDNLKIFESKYGNTVVFKRKFDKSIKISDNYITIDMDFFGSRSPVKYTPPYRLQLLQDVLNTIDINEEDIILIISLSRRWVNYDVDDFLKEMIIEIARRFNITDLINL